MKVVHVLRKPCSREAGTVAANVLRHGVGALNIDASRVAFTSEADGRWPANLVLQHLDGCRREGTKEVRVVGATAHKAHHKTHSWAVVGIQSHDHPGYRNADGNETVAAWTCEPGCPVAALDEQSGPTGSWSSKSRPSGEEHEGNLFGRRQEGNHYGDFGGGASRFFKQFGGGGS
jgi:hypothetical protein